VVDWMGFLFMGALLALYVAMCLENVAGRITPPGINTTLGKRLLAALFLAMGAACAMPPGMFLLLLLAASPVVLGILCEAPTPLASLYLPPKRLRHTLAGRWTMPFLYPGSASGLLWFTALLGGMGAILVARDSDCTRLFLLLEAAGTLLIPLLLLRLLRIRRLILLSIILQAAIFLIAILLRTRHGHDPTFSGAITLPPFGFWNYLFSSQPTLVHADNSLLLPGSILAAVLAICFVIDYRQWRTIRELQATLQTA